MATENGMGDPIKVCRIDTGVFLEPTLLWLCPTLFAINHDALNRYRLIHGQGARTAPRLLHAMLVLALTVIDQIYVKHNGDKTDLLDVSFFILDLVVTRGRIYSSTLAGDVVAMLVCSVYMRTWRRAVVTNGHSSL
ncbi:hypothetical protein GALMADRAFT_805237 [Galerina marginata CBS 339.88]|uniref:Uncharacterized protein n=1 Tax=Galerina marginata (strain CBS 339.88) TaxID=685588 RepID=A0A067SJH9_GALM3|nr:hypothetical protein GALMADRAFT_805237 [Galerina marginata CBS 339.88]